MYGTFGFISDTVLQGWRLKDINIPVARREMMLDSTIWKLTKPH
jgi:hypothetical protein